MSASDDAPVLSVRELSVEYRTKEGTIPALRNASLELRRGETLALVGESGSGKSTLGLGILRILPRNAAVTAGGVVFDGREIGGLAPSDLREIRGDEISMIFQDPIAGLNPLIPVGKQVEEVITSHREVDAKEARAAALDVLESMRLPDPGRIAKSYPGQLSGGMCQRIMIAIATALDPAVLIADEPTASLDVTVQAQILYELERMRDERGTAILLITHDMAVVAQTADRVAVIYAGAVAEIDDARSVFSSPRHPYTWALLDALPRFDRRRRLAQIPGAPPDLLDLDGHCPYIPRCRKALNECRQSPEPPLLPLADGRPGHLLACYNPVLPDSGPA